MAGKGISVTMITYKPFTSLWFVKITNWERGIYIKKGNLVDVRIKRADLPTANSDAIYRRMQTEREREAKERKIKHCRRKLKSDSEHQDYSNKGGKRGEIRVREKLKKLRMESVGKG